MEPLTFFRTVHGLATRRARLEAGFVAILSSIAVGAEDPSPIAICSDETYVGHGVSLRSTEHQKSGEKLRGV